ncbi:neutral protease 2 [Venturia nashicola]|nr:neutral protease 2 [Venturia nashicola]
MRVFKILTVTSLAIVGSAKPTKKPDPPAQVEVTLTPQSGSLVQVSIKNVSKKKYDFFQRGSLLDENPIHKLQVRSSSGGETSFIGVHPRVRQDGTLKKESFRSLKEGKSVEYTLDAAKLYDLSAGGAFEISAEGVLPYSQPGKKKISGEATYKSNTVTLNVNSDEVKQAKRDLERRNRMQPDCTAARRDQASNALAVCSNIAFVAGEKALKGSVDQFARYFRTGDPNIRRIVSERFHAVADECAARSNKASTFCTDQRKLCRSDYISYTLGVDITNCDLYWTFPLVNNKCHGVGQATTTIHEMTHVDGLYGQATDDFPGHYGWPALMDLAPQQAIMNGDNYGYYANAVYTNDPGC